MTREDIKQWLKRYDVQNFTINDDLSVNVKGSVGLSNRDLKVIPLQFHEVTGEFYCDLNNLTSLKGTPRKVFGNFNCSNNQLKSLENGPLMVGREYYAHKNQLISLKGSPKEVGSFYCADNFLTSLEYGPLNVAVNYSMLNNKLKSLKGGPVSVGGFLTLDNNPLESLEFAPQTIGWGLNMRNSLVPHSLMLSYNWNNIGPGKLLYSSREKIEMLEQYYDINNILEIGFKELHSVIFKNKLEQTLTIKETKHKMGKI